MCISRNYDSMMGSLSVSYSSEEQFTKDLHTALEVPREEVAGSQTRLDVDGSQLISSCTHNSRQVRK